MRGDRIAETSGEQMRLKAEGEDLHMKESETRRHGHRTGAMVKEFLRR